MEGTPHELVTCAGDDGLVRVVLLLLLSAAVAGCGGSEAPPAWAGPDELRPVGGALEVEAFERYAESVDEVWEHDPEALAREFLRLGDGVATVSADGVTVLRDGLEDDSVRAERFVLELEHDGEVWSLVAARWEQRCHEGRGHQEFGPELCV